MARISVPEGTSNQPSVPSGTYNEGCRIVSIEEREVPGEKNKGQRYLDIAVQIPSPSGMVFAHTTPFGRHHTRTDANTGSKVDELLAQLGVNPRDFDTDDLVGRAVVVEVSQRSYTDSSGALRINHDIVQLAKA